MQVVVQSVLRSRMEIKVRKSCRFNLASSIFAFLERESGLNYLAFLLVVRFSAAF